MMPVPASADVDARARSMRASLDQFELDEEDLAILSGFLDRFFPPP